MYAYALEVIIGFIVKGVSFLLIAFLFDIFYELGICLLTYGGLRLVIGGVHFEKFFLLFNDKYYFIF